MRIMTNRAIITTAAALIALTTMGLQPASAGWRHSDAAVALGVFGAVLGTVAGVIAAEHAHEQPVAILMPMTMAGIIAGTFTITTSGIAIMMGGNRCRIHRCAT
jgi:ABC-type lipoprotein release transport system permease subunit